MRTILLNLPYDCRGYIIESTETGEACCVLNARLSYEQNLLTYIHELDHLKNDDLRSILNADTIENMRHKP